MDKRNAEEFVIREFGKHHSRNEITLALCEKMGFTWKDADAFIHEVETRSARSIAARQSPLIIFIAVGVLLVGIGVTCNSAVYFIDYFQTQHNTLSVEGAFEIRYMYYRGASLLTGVAMIAGGLIGSWQMISKLLKS